MDKRRLIRIGVAVGLGVAAILTARPRRRHFGGFGGPFAGRPPASIEIDAAPLLVIRGALDDVKVVAGDGTRIEIRAIGVDSVDDAVRVRRTDDGSRVRLSVRPRRRIEVRVPHGTAVRLRVAKSRGSVSGVDDVDVRCAWSKIELHDVGGDIHVRCAKASIEIDLARERETRSVDAEMAKTRFELDLPVARGGVYRIENARGNVTSPASVEGGVPVRIRAAKADVVIRAA